MKKPLVGIIMGSDSDLPIMRDTAKILDEYSVPFEINIISAHRCPKRMHECMSSLKRRGIKVIIAAAGGAAHLAGVASSLTTLPVIGVPISSKNLNGLDSLFSTVQMPPGVPVATVAINGAKNAGILAIQILALFDEALQKSLNRAKRSMEKQVNDKSDKLNKIGIDEYLNTM